LQGIRESLMCTLTFMAPLGEMRASTHSVCAGAVLETDQAGAHALRHGYAPRRGCQHSINRPQTEDLGWLWTGLSADPLFELWQASFPRRLDTQERQP